MGRIAKNIELYNLAYRLAWKHISERQKYEYPNVATFLHDAIRHQLKQGEAEPVFIAAETLKKIEKLTGQIHSDDKRPVPADDRNNRLRRALRFVTRGSKNAKTIEDDKRKLADGPS